MIASNGSFYVFPLKLVDSYLNASIVGTYVNTQKGCHLENAFRKFSWSFWLGIWDLHTWPLRLLSRLGLGSTSGKSIVPLSLSFSPPLLHISKYNVGPSNIYTRVFSLPFFPTLAEFYRCINTARSSLPIEYSLTTHRKITFSGLYGCLSLRVMGTFSALAFGESVWIIKQSAFFVIRRSLVQMKMKPFPRCV